MRQPRSRPDRTRRPLTAALAAVIAAGLLAGCASTKALESPNRGTTQKGLASWYGAKFHGRPTASGEIYDMNRISAAHKRLPMGTVVLVRNRDNGKKLRVPINDRGPFIKGRIIDLSVGAARQLEMFGQGLARTCGSGSSGRRPTKPEAAHLLPGPRTGPPDTLRATAAPRNDRNKRSDFKIQAGAFRERNLAADLARRLRRDLGLDKVRIRKGGGCVSRPDRPQASESSRPRGAETRESRYRAIVLH